VVGCNFAQPLNGSLFHRVTGEDFLCGFNLCARQTVKVSCIDAGGVLSTPGSEEGVLRCSFGSGFLGFFDLLFGSDFGALLQATVLRELPALGPDEVLGVLLTVLGLPIVAS
jgi:hypothetical protein